MRLGEALLPKARSAAGPIAQADATLSCQHAQLTLGNGDGAVLATPCPEVLPAEQDMGCRCV